jgi:hypothetical protein
MRCSIRNRIFCELMKIKKAAGNDSLTYSFGEKSKRSSLAERFLIVFLLAIQPISDGQNGKNNTYPIEVGREFPKEFKRPLTEVNKRLKYALQIHS